MENFELYFSVHGTRGSPTWPHPEIRLGDQDIESTGRPASNGLQVPGENGFVSCKNKFTLVNFPRRFSFKMSFNCTNRVK